MTEQITLHPLPVDMAQRLISRAARIPPAVAAALENYRLLVAQVEQLQRDGITNATINWREEKYMYLVHPTQRDGSRKREYIGADPDRQAEARARLDRYARHQELTRQANHLLSQIEHAQYFIDQILTTLREAL